MMLIYNFWRRKLTSYWRRWFACTRQVWTLIHLQILICKICFWRRRKTRNPSQFWRNWLGLCCTRTVQICQRSIKRLRINMQRVCCKRLQRTLAHTSCRRCCATSWGKNSRPDCKQRCGWASTASSARRGPWVTSWFARFVTSWGTRTPMLGKL